MFGNRVVPFAGTWIETQYDNIMKHFSKVVPFAGTWIETSVRYTVTVQFLSFPSRERGLKRIRTLATSDEYAVVPFAGTWIETH